MGAGAAAKGFNLGIIIISSSRGFAGHDEMDPCLVTWGEEFFMAPPRRQTALHSDGIVIARSEATRRSKRLQGARRLLDCFASLAMTIAVRPERNLI
jgi:hypothetical protein